MSLQGAVELSIRRRVADAASGMGAALAVVLGLAGLLAPQPAFGQYVGKVSETDKSAAELRAVAVLEWTGEAGNPKASRLVPITVLDGGQLQDGGVYLARPEPMALFPDIEYVLQQDGKPIGLFDIDSAGQQLGSWIGLGSWKPMPTAKPKPTAAELAKTNFDDDEPSDGQPVLHRKHHADDAPGAGSGGASSAGSSSSSAPASDPDRPVLHKKADSTESSPASGTTSGASPSSAGSGTGSDSDPDRPTLHRKDSASDSSSTSDSDDPDRPTLHRTRHSLPAKEADAEPIRAETDPDRPHLKRGKADSNGLVVIPTLLGLPPDLNQAVAVSDAKPHPDHAWDFTWTNPDDEDKIKSALENIARDALGLNAPPAPAKPAARRTATRRTAKPVAPPPPAPLEGEQFRVFELAYGSGATLVLSAHTDGPAPQQKFVTLIAQPDLYGNVLVLKKNVTDGAHLDDTPRMRLIDAVDAMADNRGELLFELRGVTQRQFVLYRVLRGQAEQLFVTGGGQFGAASE